MKDPYLSRRELADVVVEAGGHVKPEDRRYTGKVVQDHIKPAEDFAEAIGRQEVVTGEIYKSSIKKCLGWLKPRKDLPSLTFSTERQSLRLLGYTIAIGAILAMIYVGAVVRNGLAELNEQHTKQQIQQQKMYDLLQKQKSE